jgi:hypothetical protein
LRKNRKQRHAKLKEIIAQDEDEESKTLAEMANSTTCPVCLAQLSVDRGAVDAHVDACLANAQQEEVIREQREALSRFGEDVDAWGEVEVDGTTRIRLNNVAGLRGTGIDVRDRTQADVEEEVDVDGDDEAVFGDVQFTERDVLGGEGEDVLVDIDGDGDGNAGGEGGANGDGGGEGEEASSLRALVAQGKVVSRRQVTSAEGVKHEMDEVMGLAETDLVERAVQEARVSGDTRALVKALEGKIRYLVSCSVSQIVHSVFMLRSTTNRTICRSPHAFRPPRPHFAAFVWTHTTNLLSRPAVGIRVVESVG